MRKLLRALLAGTAVSTLAAVGPAAGAVVWSLDTPVDAGAPKVLVAEVVLTQMAGGVAFDLHATWPTSDAFFGTGAFLREFEFTFSGAAQPALALVGGGGSYLFEGGTFAYGVDNNDLGFTFKLDLLFIPSGSQADDRFETGDTFSFLLQGTTLAQFTNLVSGPGNSGEFQTLALAKIQGLADDGSIRYVTGNGKQVPEPVTSGLLVAAALAAALTRRRRR